MHNPMTHQPGGVYTLPPALICPLGVDEADAKGVLQDVMAELEAEMTRAYLEDATGTSAVITATRQQYADADAYERDLRNALDSYLICEYRGHACSGGSLYDFRFV